MKKAIKGAEFLVRDVGPEDIFITEEFTEEQNMMKDVSTRMAPHQSTMTKLNQFSLN